MRIQQAWRVAVAFAVLWASEAAAETPAATVRLEVRVLADARIPPDVLERAKPEVARIYRRIGVDLVWLDEWNTRSITVHVIVGSLKEADSSAMGATPRLCGQVGRLLYVFYSRVETFARLHDERIAQVLGHVIAHELGHVLLHPASHAVVGIMVADWKSAQVAQMGRGDLSFTWDEAEAIRRKARALEIAR